jgi:hypothetical protein
MGIDMNVMCIVYARVNHEPSFDNVQKFRKFLENGCGLLFGMSNRTYMNESDYISTGCDENDFETFEMFINSVSTKEEFDKLMKEIQCTYIRVYYKYDSVNTHDVNAFVNHIESDYISCTDGAMEMSSIQKIQESDDERDDHFDANCEKLMARMVDGIAKLISVGFKSSDIKYDICCRIW